MKMQPLLIPTCLMMLASNQVFAEIECPSVQEVQANAYRLDTIMSEASLKKAPFPVRRLMEIEGADPTRGTGVFSSNAMKTKRLPWYLVWGTDAKLSKNQALQEAYSKVSLMDQLGDSVVNDDKKDPFTICLYVQSSTVFDQDVNAVLLIYKAKNTPFVVPSDAEQKHQFSKIMSSRYSVKQK